MKPTIVWRGGVEGHLELLDQTVLPAEQAVLQASNESDVIHAIRRLAVRGAPAIGVAAAYGVFLGVRARQPVGAPAFRHALQDVADLVERSRPTAVNLSWAVDRMRRAGRATPTLDGLLAEARAIHEQDIALCRAMGEGGWALIRDGMTVLTHCNTGRLATAGDGTALALVFEAWRRGRRFQMIADETRPLLQGARLTALELSEEGIPVDVIADSAAAGLISRGAVDLVLTGADRIAANGDAANKVGTYGLALACQAHSVPFYVVAPTSTFDLSIPDGTHIPIEDRGADEVLELAGQRIAAPKAGARNPAFDVTPGHLIAGLVTDRGIVAPVTAENVKAVLGAGRSTEHGTVDDRS